MPMRRLALSIYFRNARVYTFLRKIFALPSRSLLRGYASLFNSGVGWSEFAFKVLKEKLEKKTLTNKVCAISIDAMDISKGISYHVGLDKFDGFEDMGPYGRNEKLAKQALVFMVQGVGFKYKQAVGYFIFSKRMNSDQVKPMVLDCITKLREIGAIPKVIICDQGGPHRGLYTKLGATIEEPYFDHTHNDIESRIFTLWDTPHLLKSLRNNLINHDIQVGGIVVSWGPFRYLHEIQQQHPKEFRMAPKLTSKHIQPNKFEKMRVFLATRVFSNTVAAALQTLASYVEDEGTAEGLRNAAVLALKMNRIFDIFNSSSSHSYQTDKLPIMRDNRQIDVLEREFLPWFKSLKILRPEKPEKIPVEPSATPIVKPADKPEYTPCIKGWKQNIICLKMLWTELRDVYGFERLFTRRLNQDTLENYFSSVRNSGGNNINPDSAKFQTIMHGLITNQIMQVTVAGSNCEDDLTPLLEKVEKQMATKKQAAATKNRVNVQGIDEVRVNNEYEDTDGLGLEEATDDPMEDRQVPIVRVVDHERGVVLIDAPFCDDEERSMTLIALGEDSESGPDAMDILFVENRDGSPLLTEVCETETLSYVAGYSLRSIRKHVTSTVQNVSM